MKAFSLAFVILASSSALAACGRSTSGGEAAGSAPSPEAARLLAELPAPYSHGDLENGRLHFNLCRACHTVVQGGPNMVGPNLYGVFGRRVASLPGFDYSTALRAKDWVWDAPHLNAWLTDPRAYVPGTRMSFYGLHDDKDRIDTIAYLKVASGGGPL